MCVVTPGLQRSNPANIEPVWTALAIPKVFQEVLCLSEARDVSGRVFANRVNSGDEKIFLVF